MCREITMLYRTSIQNAPGFGAGIYHAVAATEEEARKWFDDVVKTHITNKTLWASLAVCPDALLDPEEYNTVVTREFRSSGAA
jgi:hypothetical protein